MSITLLQQLIWADYRAAVVLTIVLPLMLLIWATVQREGAIGRLLNLYWKVSSLLAITVLLLAGAEPMAFAVAVAAHLLILGSLWFWEDINDELADLPPWRALPLVTRIWRWSLTVFTVVGCAASVASLNCLGGWQASRVCVLWQHPPGSFSQVLGHGLNFLFGSSWAAEGAKVAGWLCLVIYAGFFLQWLLVRWPRFGRVAGGF
ncbi:MAG: membrane protein [Candidatus Synechococcus spongiarum SP3]|uniref:Membrane protein n=1 Tax=Candidatus Synechococcus spongiarum SP3 TaxID=1604020 RepID=A0A0G2J5J1_9SYNE|nr:MAG: membrane protein [Candidatus Synechococcus spongiarum SP3]